MLSKIEVIVPPHVVEDLCEELSAMKVGRIIAIDLRTTGTVCESKLQTGLDCTKGQTRAHAVQLDELLSSAMVKIEVVVPKSKTARVVSTMERCSRRGRHFDAKIAIVPVERSFYFNH